MPLIVVDKLYMALSLFKLALVDVGFSQDHLDVVFVPVLSRQVLQENDDVVELHLLELDAPLEDEGRAYVD